jgi:hypothetical protein
VYDKLFREIVLVNMMLKWVMGNGIYAKVFAPQKLLRRLGNGSEFLAMNESIRLKLYRRQLRNYALLLDVQVFDVIWLCSNHRMSV